MIRSRRRSSGSTSDEALDGRSRPPVAGAAQAACGGSPTSATPSITPTRRGVIHRDIKPANIIVGKHGETLVVDWGLAKAVGRADPSVGEQTLAPSSSGSSETLPGSALGTPAYMSPEQARGDLDRLGPRSDVYSLGATLYCLLDRQAAVRGRRHRRDLACRAGGAIPAAVPARSRARQGAGGRLPEGHGHRARGPLRHAQGPGRRPRALDGRRAGHGLARAVLAAGTAVGAAEPHGGHGRGGGAGGRGGRASARAGRADPGQRRPARCQRRGQRRVNSDLAAEQAGCRPGTTWPIEAIKTFHTGVSEDFLLKQEQFKDLRDRLLKSASDFYGKLGALAGQGVGPGIAAGARGRRTTKWPS